jgi:hypothetical protein
LKIGISSKAVFPFLWRLRDSMLHRSDGQSSVKSFIRLSRWWLGIYGGSGEAFFNKRYLALLWCGWCLLLLPSLPSHGGAERGWPPAMSCSIGGDWGVQKKLRELDVSSPLVVHPRWLGDGRRQWFFAGRELSSILLLILSGDDWRTRAISGGDTQVLDCFLSFVLGHLLEFGRPFLQIVGSLERDLKGLSAKMYMPPF